MLGNEHATSTLAFSGSSVGQLRSNKSMFGVREAPGRLAQVSQETMKLASKGAEATAAASPRRSDRRTACSKFSTSLAVRKHLNRITSSIDVALMAKP